MRRQVSLLRDAGHDEATRYPVGMVWDEARLVVERINSLEATRATLLHMAVSAVLSADAGKEFDKTIKRLTET